MWKEAVLIVLGVLLGGFIVFQTSYEMKNPKAEPTATVDRFIGEDEPCSVKIPVMVYDEILKMGYVQWRSACMANLVKGAVDGN